MSDRINLALASVSLLSLVLADIATTIMFRSRGLPEANPLVKPFVDNTATFITVKVEFVVALVLILVVFRDLYRTGRIAVWIWATAAVIGVAVVVNLSVLI